MLYLRNFCEGLQVLNFSPTSQYKLISENSRINTVSTDELLSLPRLIVGLSSHHASVKAFHYEQRLIFNRCVHFQRVHLFSDFPITQNLL